MLTANPALKATRATLDGFAGKLSGALTDILARLPADCPEFCKADFFVELASLAWHDSGTGQHDERMKRTVQTLTSMAHWIGNDGMHRLSPQRSIAEQLFEVFSSIRRRIPKRVFLARWYPTDADGSEKTRADLRLDILRQTVEGDLGLELVDMGTREGGTYQIPPAMYDAIKSAEIIVADLTGVRPNVMIEVGFALAHHHKGRLLLYYETTGGAKVPFDLASFQYIPVNQAAEIRSKVGAPIRSILQAAATGQI